MAHPLHSRPTTHKMVVDSETICEGLKVMPAACPEMHCPSSVGRPLNMAAFHGKKSLLRASNGTTHTSAGTQKFRLSLQAYFALVWVLAQLVLPECTSASLACTSTDMENVLQQAKGLHANA